MQSKVTSQLLSTFLVVIIQSMTTNGFTQTLSVLDADQVAQIIRSGATPYALVARPFDVTMEQVDLVTLNPTTLQPLARGVIADIRCARLHASPSGELLCMSNNTKIKGRFEFSGPYAATYSRDLSSELSKVNETSNARISRARISTDGKTYGWTYFIKGHNYKDAGTSQFSTLTQISIPSAGKKIEHNLEGWPLLHKNELVKAIDLNYWGVSFHPKNSQQFLATAFFKGKAYLALGDLTTKTMKVIFEGIECPSYSPSGDTIAFKSRVSITRWAPATLDLKTMKTTVFSHITHSVDDQIDWLDANTLVYEIVNTPLIGEASVDLVTLDISKSNQPHKMWLKNARSAALYLPK